MSPYEVVFCFVKANPLDKLFAFANIVYSSFLETP